MSGNVLSRCITTGVSSHSAVVFSLWNVGFFPILHLFWLFFFLCCFFPQLTSTIVAEVMSRVEITKELLLKIVLGFSNRHGIGSKVTVGAAGRENVPRSYACSRKVTAKVCITL